MVGRRLARAVPAWIVAAIVLAACGGGGGGGGDRQDYVDALVAASGEAESGTLTAEQETCFAEAIVDAVGVGRLADEVSPGEIRDQANTNLPELGVDVEESDGADYYERVRECAELRDVLVHSEVGTTEITDAATTCFQQNLTDDLIREFFVAGYVHSRDELAQDTELVGRLQEAFSACAGA
jgi:hypothetical protein